MPGRPLQEIQILNNDQDQEVVDDEAERDAEHTDHDAVDFVETDNLI